MRNPLARLVQRDTAKPSLRERFVATREKYARTLRVHRALNGTLPVQAGVVPPRDDASPDAVLTKALGDLQRLDAAIDAFHLYQISMRLTHRGLPALRRGGSHPRDLFDPDHRSGSKRLGIRPAVSGCR